MICVTFSGHYQGNVMVSVVILLLCGFLTAILLIGSGGLCRWLKNLRNCKLRD